MTDETKSAEEAADEPETDEPEVEQGVAHDEDNPELADEPEATPEASE